MATEMIKKRIQFLNVPDMVEYAKLHGGWLMARKDSAGKETGEYFHYEGYTQTEIAYDMNGSMRIGTWKHFDV